MLDQLLATADCPDHFEPASRFDWLKDNIGSPLANGLVVEPHNAVANAVNAITSETGSGPWLSQWQEEQSGEVAFGSPSWAVRTITRGLAAAAPYAVAGLILRAPLRTLSESFAVESSTARVLRSSYLSQIAGAAAYDGLKDTQPGESHSGNGLGSASAFTLLTLGNGLSARAPLAVRLPALMLAGAAGAAAALEVSTGWSQHRLAGKDELIQAELSGAFMNTALPGVQHLLGSAVSRFNMATGKGEPLDRYMERSANVPAEIRLVTATALAPMELFRPTKTGTATGDATLFPHSPLPLQHSLERSAFLRSLVSKHANTRVLETVARTAYLPVEDQVLLAKNNRNAEAIAHETTHAELVKSGQLEPGFARARAALALGDIDAARAVFVDTCVSGELEAMRAQARVRAELPVEAIMSATETPSPAQRNTASMQLLRAEIEQRLRSWLENEFTQFQESGGEHRPALYEQSARSIGSTSRWTNSYNAWPELAYKDKIDLVRDLHKAPEEVKAKLYLLAMENPLPIKHEPAKASESNQIWRIRDIVDSKFTSLSPAQRLKVFKEQIASDDYFVRALALSHLGDLPAVQRLRAFNDVINHPRALLLPVPKHHNLWSNENEHAPPNSLSEKHRLHAILAKTPARLLVESIATLPAKERDSAWLKAYERPSRRYKDWTFLNSSKDVAEQEHYKLVESRLDRAAFEHFDVLPDQTRFLRWSQAWDTKTTRPRYNETAAANSLVEQIPHLPNLNRNEALHRVFVSTVPIEGAALAKAIASLPEADRGQTLRKFFLRSSLDWSSSAHLHYEPDYFADSIAAQNFARAQASSQENAQAWQSLKEDLGVTSEHTPSFLTSTNGIMRGLGAPIAFLPEGERFPAWRALAHSEPRLYINELLTVIPALPERAQPTALRWLLNYAADKTEDNTDKTWQAGLRRNIYRGISGDKIPIINIWDANRVMAALSPSGQQESLKALFGMPPGWLRDKLLGDYPIEQLVPDRFAEKMTDQDRQAAADRFTPLFQSAFSQASSPNDYGALRRWWERVSWRESYEPDQLQSRVRALVADRLPAVQLGRMLAPRLDWEATDKLAAKHPEIIRSLANVEVDYWAPDHDEPLSEEEERLQAMLKGWQEEGSLKAAAEAITQGSDQDEEQYVDNTLLTHLYGQLARVADRNQAEETLTWLKDMVLKDEATADQKRSPESTIATPLLLAAKMAESDAELFSQIFARPIEERLLDDHADHNWRLSTAREIAHLERNGDLPENTFTIPDLRMSKVALADAQRALLKEQFTAALFDENKTIKLWGDGPFGKLFPQYFGHYESDGGIVGRPQHGGHEFPVDTHTLLVMRRAREHALFDTLSHKEQENLLAAIMMHDIAKRPNMKDPEHEWVGANAAWGIISTLGYTPVRTQRIFDLISRHSEVSYVPHELASKALTNAGKLDDIASHYRYPKALTQLRIFNEADIRSIDSDSSLWTQDVAAELDSVRDLTEARVAQLNGHIIPLLTTELPTKFTLVKMEQPFGLLAHATSTIHEAFLKQLSVIESPEYSISSTLVTNKVQQLYSDEHQVFALVAGPAEHIAKAYRENLSTGGNVNWAGHIKLASDFATSPSAKEFAAELDAIARHIDSPHKLKPRANSNTAGSKEQAKSPQEITVENPGSVDEHPHLDEAIQIFARYDSLDELIKEQGDESRYVKLQRAFHQSLTHDKDGQPLEEHNEVKMVNPAFVGLGILRKGQPILFEGMTGDGALDKLLEGQQKPAWLLNGTRQEGKPPQSTIVIPKSTWQALLARDLPIVVLDPH